MNNLKESKTNLYISVFSPETQGAGVAWKVRNSVTLIRHFHPIEMYQREAENQELWITWRYCDLNLEILWSITSMAIEVLSREDMRGQQGLATGARGVAFGWLNSRQISAWGHECITIVTWILNLALSDEKDTGFIQNCCMEPTFFTLNFFFVCMFFADYKDAGNLFLQTQTHTLSYMPCYDSDEART